MEKEFDILTGAKRLEEVRFSKIRTVMDMVADLRAKGEEVLSLSAGEPDFNTPATIKEAVIKALEENYTHYGSNRGYPALRKLLSKKLEKETGVSYDPETEIIFTTGGAEALNNAFMAVVDPGDEVIVFSPAFITYENLVHMCGAKLVKVPLKKENNYQINMDDLKAAVTDKTKLLVMNNPNNPTGAVYSKECLEQVCELAKEKNFLIISDEMYSRLVYGDGKFYSIASFPGMKERTIIINGFSKTYAMTGWRVGYVAAPARILPSILKVHQYCSTCCPTFIHVPETEESVCKMVDEFAKRRQVLIEGLDQIPGITYVKPEGAFYAMVDVSAFGVDGDTFAAKLLKEKHVAVIPGSGLGENCKDAVRISFAASEDTIRKATERIKEFIQEKAYES